MQSNYSNLHSAKLAIKAWLNPPRSLQPRLSSLSPCKSKMVSWKLSLGMPAKATATLWPSSKQPPGVESTSCNAATLQPPPSQCESSSFPEACQKSDSPNPSQAASSGMNHLLELPLSPPTKYKEAEAYHLHSLREEKLNPSLEIRIAQIWAASKPVLCYYRDGYYRALPHNVRFNFLNMSLENKCY